MAGDPPIMKKILLKAVAIGAVGAAVIFLMTAKPSAENATASYVPREKTALEKYIDKLAHNYECIECPENYRRIDSNGYYSYACLQFQWATFKDRVRRYKLAEYAENAELMNLIYDCDFQKQVALKMFQNEKNAWTHWRTSVKRGLGLPPT